MKTFKGFHPDDLRRTFNEICDPYDWKAPIIKEIAFKQVKIAAAAIIYFTATEPKVSYNIETGTFIISSIGYRLGPAGDH